MEYACVNLLALDSVEQTPLTGAAFKVLSVDGHLVHTMAQADAQGIASLLLPQGVYEVRPYCFGVSFGQPRRICVIPDEPSMPQLPVNNTFEFPGVTFKPGTPLDRRFCVASGFFRGSDGAGAFTQLTFIPKFSPVLLDGTVVLPDRITVQTNPKGFAEVQLIRGAEYTVEVGGVQQLSRDVYVPDAPYWSLAELLFPRVQRVNFGPEVVDRELSIRVGAAVEVGALLVASDGRTLCYPYSAACWSVADPSMVALQVNQYSLRFLGLRVGTTLLRVERTNASVLSIPNRLVENTPVLITVTP